MLEDDFTLQVFEGFNIAFCLSVKPVLKSSFRTVCIAFMLYLNNFRPVFLVTRVW